MCKYFISTIWFCSKLLAFLCFIMVISMMFVPAFAVVRKCLLKVVFTLDTFSISSFAFVMSFRSIFLNSKSSKLLYFLMFWTKDRLAFLRCVCVAVEKSLLLRSLGYLNQLNFSESDLIACKLTLFIMPLFHGTVR